MKIVKTFIAVVALAMVASSAQAEFVTIDNFANPSFGSVQTQSVGGITVNRTITNTVPGASVQFSHSGTQFGVVDQSGAGGLPQIGTFTYTTSGGTFEELLQSSTGNTGLVAHGIRFNYNVFNFDVDSQMNYSVRVFAGAIGSSTEIGFSVLNPSLNTYVFDQQGSSIFNVNEIKLQFERDTNNGGGFFSVGNNLSVTPEPSAAFLFGTLAIGFVGRRRRQS